MSQIFIGKNSKPIAVMINGLDIKPVSEKVIVFMFSSQIGDYKFTVTMDKEALTNVALMLAYPPDPCPDHLVLNVSPDGVEDKRDHKIALDEMDRDLIKTVLGIAPSLLEDSWLTEKDSDKLLEAFEGLAEKIELEPDRN